MSFGMKSLVLPEPDQALPGRDTPVAVPLTHAVNGKYMQPPYPDGYGRILLGLGCFWGAERRFWQLPGVHVTAVGYAGGYTPNPYYEEVCSGRTGHAEVVQVVYDPEISALTDLFKVFWESHDPSQGMRQGTDIGTQYRSVIYVSDDEQLAVALASREHYQSALRQAGRTAAITTEIALAPPFYFAEDYHQQYLAKNPQGYCGLAGTGVSPPLEASATKKAGLNDQPCQ